MFRGLRVAVAIPAYNEEETIAATIRSVPGFVDHVLVIDDASADRTAAAVARSRRRGLELLRHPRNLGVGAAIVTGYRRALALDADVAAVMAGDGQMDPADLPRLLTPIAAGRAAYVKGNRFAHPDVRRVMPRWRWLGNIILSWLTRLSSGYHRIFDSQCGYTAASREALQAIEPGWLFPRYGYPNDILARLNVAGLVVEDVAVRPIYGPRWRSGITLATVIYPILFVLVRSFAWRLLAKGHRWLRHAVDRLRGRAHLAFPGQARG